jgi:hypothetical protein
MKKFREFFKTRYIKSESIKYSIVILIIVFSFGALTFSTLVDKKIGTIGISTSSTASEIREAWGPTDAGSLLDVALSWSKFDSLDEVEQHWIVRAWTPGMSILEVPLIWLEDIIPLYWSLLIITITLWTSIFFIYWKKFHSQKIRYVLILFFLGMMFSWDFRYMFVDRLFHTEALGFGLLFLSLTLASFDQSHDPTVLQRKKFAAIGVILGLSLWIRHTSDFGMVFLLLLAYFLSKYIKISKSTNQAPKKHRYSKQRRIRGNSGSQLHSAEKTLRRNFRQITVVCLIALVVTVPWRIIGMSLYGNSKPVMSTSFQTLGPQLWAPPGSEKAVYWESEGMNWACEIDLEKCKKPELQSGGPAFQLQEAIKTAISNPIKFLQIRSQDFKNNWIPDDSLYPQLHNFISSLQGLLIFASVYLFSKIRSPERIKIVVIWGSFILLNFAQLLILHYESRYFIPIRLLFIGLFVNLYVIYVSEFSRKSKPNSTIM